MRSSRVFAVFLGASAVLRAPWWIRGAGLERLVRGSTGGAGRSGNVKLAIHAARVALRVLSRLPGLPWRNTCLYRSVAECLVLRAHAMPFRLLLGVTRDAAVSDSIVAHAWVGGANEPSMNGLAPLEFRGGGNARR
jgi:hypothetical protein